MIRLNPILAGLMMALALSLTACGGGGGGDGGGGTGGGGTGTVAGTTFAVSPLANLAGGSFSAGVAINSVGVAVGYADDGTTLKGVKWSVATPAVAEQLNPLDDDASRYSAAYGVNTNGTAVGESENGVGIVAVHWPAGEVSPTALSTTGLPAGNSAAYAVNGSGEIVGEAADGGGITAAVYWAGTGADPLVLGNLSAGADAFSAAYYINDAGFVVGESLNADGETQAVVWTPGAGGVFVGGEAPLPLAEIAGQTGSVAFGVDLSGNIVGEAEAGGEVFGVVWNPDRTVNQTLQAASSAQFINDNERIVGYVDANSTSDIATVWSASDTADNKSLSTAAFSQAYAANEDMNIVGLADDQAFVAVPQ